MAEIIQIDEETRIRRMDALNWTVEVYAESKAKDGTVSMKWRNANLSAGTGPYFGRLSAAFRWLLDYMANRDAPAETDMDGYLEVYARTADRLIAVARGLDR